MIIDDQAGSETGFHGPDRLNLGVDGEGGDGLGCAIQSAQE